MIPATLDLFAELEELEGPKPAPSSSKRKPKRSSSSSSHSCAACGRPLKNEAWIYSRHTGARYCLPGPKGCNK